MILSTFTKTMLLYVQIELPAILFISDRNAKSAGVMGAYESIRKRSFVGMDNFVRHGSLERPKSVADKIATWNVEEISEALENFRPVTLTVSSFFKQVCVTCSNNARLKSYLKHLRT